MRMAAGARGSISPVHLLRVLSAKCRNSIRHERHLRSLSTTCFAGATTTFSTPVENGTHHQVKTDLVDRSSSGSGGEEYDYAGFPWKRRTNRNHTSTPGPDAQMGRQGSSQSSAMGAIVHLFLVEQGYSTAATLQT